MNSVIDLIDVSLRDNGFGCIENALPNIGVRLKPVLSSRFILPDKKRDKQVTEPTVSVIYIKNPVSVGYETTVKECG
jgi:hypothetical protein